MDLSIKAAWASAVSLARILSRARDAARSAA